MSFYPNFNTSSIDSSLNINALLIQGTNISSAGANDNDVLTFDLLSNQWQPEALPAPPAVNTIYTADGSLTGNRVVTTGANSLTLTNGSNASIALNSPAGEVVITSATQIDIDSANVRLPSIAIATKSDVLYYDNVSHLVSYGASPTTSNIYTTDGTISGNRSVNTSTNRLRITNNTTDFIDVNNPINAGGVLINSQVGDINLFAQGVGTADISLVADNNITVQSANNMTVQGSAKVDVISGGAITLNGTSIKLTNAPATDNNNTNLLSRNLSTGNIELRTVASLNTGTANVIPFFNASGVFTTNDTSNTYEPTAKSTKIGTNGSAAAGFYSAVLGGELNTGNGQSAVVLGGRSNAITGGAVRTGILAGEGNGISGGSTSYSTIVGGSFNSIGDTSTSNSIISSASCSSTGGLQNSIFSATNSSIGGGGSNNTIIGGNQSIISAGSGSVIVADNQAVTNTNTQSQSMKIRFANGVNITNNGANNDNSTPAVFQVDSTTKGVILPRMTTTNKNNIASPVNGLIVYDTILSSLQLYTSAWKYLRANAVEIAETPVSALAPTNGQILQLVAGTWTPSTLPVSTFIRLNPNANFANNQYTQTGGQSSTESTGQSLIYQTSTLVGFRVNLTVAPGVGNSRTFTLRVNGVNTALAITITGASLTGSATGSVVLVAGDLVSCLHVASGATNSQGQIVIAINQG